MPSDVHKVIVKRRWSADFDFQTAGRLLRVVSDNRRQTGRVAGRACRPDSTRLPLKVPTWSVPLRELELSAGALKAD